MAPALGHKPPPAMQKRSGKARRAAQTGIGCPDPAQVIMDAAAGISSHRVAAMKWARYCVTPSLCSIVIFVYLGGEHRLARTKEQRAVILWAAASAVMQYGMINRFRKFSLQRECSD
jgi:hypothetical protein